MSTILILGGGRWQLPLIALARALGHRVVVADEDPKAVGFALADVPVICDICNPAMILESIRGLRVDAVTSDQIEIALLAASEVAKTLGLPHTARDVIVRGTDKYLMRKCWKDAGINIPRFACVTSEAEMLAFADEFGFPVISKPLSSSGSRGVSVSRLPADIARAFAMASAVAGKPEVIVENFIDGREYTAEAFSIGGRVTVLAVSQKLKPESQFQVATLLEYPPDLPSTQLLILKSTVEHAVAALGIVDGPSHSEILLSPAGPVMVETGPRGAGFRVSSDVIRLASGFDQTAALLKLALGERVDVPKLRNDAVTLGFFCPTPGRVTAIDGIDKTHSLETLRAFEIWTRPGDVCRELTADGARSGYFILHSQSVEKVRRDTANIYRDIQFRIDTNYDKNL